MLESHIEELFKAFAPEAVLCLAVVAVAENRVTAPDIFDQYGEGSINLVFNRAEHIQFEVD